MTELSPPFARYQSIIDDWEGFQDSLTRPLPTCIWANPLKTSPEELEALLRQESISFQPLSWRPGAYRLLNTPRPGNRIAAVAGLYQIQEEVSMLPLELMDLHPGQRVLDTCAAPGNKTAQIAAALGNTGTLLANDRSFHRLKPLGRALDRLGIYNTSVMICDAANFPASIGTFDRILADVPCSCEGTSRKKLQAREATADDFRSLCNMQTAILRRSLELLRPGGRLVYSTCTFAPEENEAIIDAVLRDFSLPLEVLPARIEGFPATPGLVEWRGRQFDPRLERTLRVYPHQHDTGGFFLAVLERPGS